MSTILVVDDRAPNRDVLVALLGHCGHHLLETSDGCEALRVAQAERPDLVIADILMPTMDGFEFVRQLRAAQAIANTRVIFSTAHYLEREASSLASACGVSFILYKPCDPEIVLRTVDTALGLSEPPAASLNGDAFDREHLRLLMDQLSQNVDELRAVDQKLAALIELSQHLVSEHETMHLLEKYSHSARNLIGAQCSTLALLSADEQTLHHFYASGLDDALVQCLNALPSWHRVLGKLLRERRPCRLRNPNGDPHVIGFPLEFPPLYMFLGVPILFQARLYGWLRSINKLWADEFSEADEQLAVMLAAQMAVAYENAQLYRAVQDHAAELEREVAQRRPTEEQLRALNAALEQHVSDRTAQLEASNKELEAFSSAVSHDLRARLRSIDGFSTILLEEYANSLDADGQDHLNRSTEDWHREVLV